MIQTEPLAPDARKVNCPRCGSEHAVEVSDALEAGVLRRCPCCGGDELYLRRDFPQRLGLAIVVAAALTSIVLFGMGRVLGALGVLAAVVVVDLVIFALVAQVTKCYRCRAEFREIAVNPAHTGFDLAVAEKYRTPPGLDGPDSEHG